MNQHAPSSPIKTLQHPQYPEVLHLQHQLQPHLLKVEVDRERHPWAVLWRLISLLTTCDGNLLSIMEALMELGYQGLVLAPLRQVELRRALRVPVEAPAAAAIAQPCYPLERGLGELVLHLMRVSFYFFRVTF